MKRVLFCCVLVGCFVSLFSGISFAHFGMVIPSDTMVMPGDPRVVRVTISFSHPFEGNGMDLAKPREFGVMIRGKRIDLLSQLKETKVMGHKAWDLEYKIKRPGVYQFYMVPKPYWEPAEDKYIIHYTKTVIGAFGNEEGWDQMVGLKTEIVPLSRPFGLYAGNVFQGTVLLDGKPLPYAEVEVEYYNKDHKAIPPTDYMVTQVIKADANGVFTYAVPHSGWWGFAALTTSKEKMKYRGQEKEVELGAVIWVKFEGWNNK
ncbi:MAG: DUF4198 domain-containing protein [Deltaproteobacteria bacterium]|nr:DUF4198 domain-containing protein [Deltaproteobacteria bacterium]MBW1930325.1 DUF4198 domain-containing protein [Deltaproteobacteria bacterium]MBW2025291.1 DUF4198 domain-containing protein [Deltaproteobacteria bacterium]MBW2125270.1 DUF4198 domain-containing protein [Deltaproteobacteria bacterium]RLB17743.1 MAG: DUF4198 domain-containing protein [Deltaproteobacteria bacterium]